MVRIERDPIVSYLSGTEPHKIEWNPSFVSKVLVYGVIPMLMLFTAYFPEVGGAILRWLTPVAQQQP